MLACIPFLQEGFYRYAGHIVRERHQKRDIAAIHEGLSLHPEESVVVIDHKQKVLPMKYREGQSNYFGKKGMSVLGIDLTNY